MNKLNILQKQEWPDWTASAIALLGLIAYTIQAVIFAHTTVSNLDEGAYRLKGILFASGKYHPFDPGISTNKAPLAFLIPGYIQLLFGAGLRTGRYLAVFFGTMAVVGTWVAAHRLSGKWLAAGAVWILALSPAVIKFYSGGATQSTIAFLLAWSLVFSLGEKRPLWQLALSGFLAGVMMLVRQNMMPVLPLLVIYAFWEHRSRAIWLLFAGVAVVLAIHILYWPNILQIWTWIPLISFPAGSEYAGGGTRSWTPDIGLSSRLLSIFQAFRIHFAVLAGGIVCMILWPKISDWKSRADYRVGLFLLVLFLSLVYMHSVAAIGRDYCVYCFAPYVAFFNIAGILLLILIVKSWNWRPSVLMNILIVVFFLIVLTGMSYSAFEDIGPWILNLPAPRMRDLTVLPGFVTWWEILSNRYHLNYNLARKYASAIFGLLIGGFISLLVYIVWRRIWRNSSLLSFGAIYASAILVLGIILSPILNGRFGFHDCRMDVISANEQIGTYLRSLIPTDNLVYWDGGLSVAPLLYLPDAKIIPAQINAGYTYYGGGDTTELYKFGLWNQEMDNEWKATAKFFIIEESRYASWQAFLTPNLFDEYGRSPVGTSCQEESRLRIFRRK